MNKGGYWPYTPNTNLLYGLSKPATCCWPRGWTQVFARHQRWGEGVRAAVRAWGLPIQCADPAVYSPVLTGVIMPEGVDADAVRKLIHERFDCSLGTGLGKVKGRMFRIGHLGDCNDLTLMAALAGCEMGLKLAGVSAAGSGVQAAMEYFARAPGCAITAGPRKSHIHSNQRPFHAGLMPISFTKGDKPCNEEHLSPQPPPPWPRRWLHAQTLPSGPVRIVVGFPPGGGTDALARVVGQKLADHVEPVRWCREQGRCRRRDRGRTSSASSPAMASTCSWPTSTAMRSRRRCSLKLRYNAEKDFVPISMVGVTPNLLICNPDQPAKTVKDLVALCKANPGKISFASAGGGSAQHFALEMFKLQAQVFAHARALQGSAARC
jgi:hypothetical protein